MRRLNYVLYIALFLSLLLSLGVINWAGADFRRDILTDGSFWLDTVSKSLSFLGSYILATLWRRDSIILKEPTYDELKVEVKQLSDMLVDADFPDFISRYNRRSKIESWKDVKTHELDKHINKANQVILDDLRLPPSEWSKKTTRWVDKREKLKEELTPEFIEENIDYKIIKYPAVTVSEVQAGIRTIVPEGSLLKKGYVRHIVRERWTWVIGNILINAFLASIIIKEGQWGAAEFLNLLIIISGFLINITMGFRNGEDHYEQIDLYNLNTRKMIFIEWGFEREKLHQKQTPNGGEL